jgi:hypothetical protein
MRRSEDKSSGNFDPKWPAIFNAVIESLDLREIVMSGRQFTWAGPGDNPTFEKLDRVLVSTDWEIQFPLSKVEPRDRNISDHTPLVLSTGVSTHLTGNRPFKFERGWLVRDGFYDMVANIWQSKSSGSTPLEHWQFKIRRLRQHLRGWARHTAGSYKKEKKTLLSLLEDLDKKAKSDHLSDQEVNIKHYLKEHLVTLLQRGGIKVVRESKG